MTFIFINRTPFSDILHHATLIALDCFWMLGGSHLSQTQCPPCVFVLESRSLFTVAVGQGLGQSKIGRWRPGDLGKGDGDGALGVGAEHNASHAF